jgi:hypothetical protein
MNNFITKPIPKSLVSTKVLLDAYINLREISNGKCSSSCPRDSINFGNYTKTIQSKKKYLYKRKKLNIFCTFCWDCWDCTKLGYFPCPCHTNLSPKKIFLRLDEVIDQLRKKLEKEFSG